MRLLLESVIFFPCQLSYLVYVRVYVRMYVCMYVYLRVCMSVTARRIVAKASFSAAFLSSVYLQQRALLEKVTDNWKINQNKEDEGEIQRRKRVSISAQSGEKKRLTG